jgi:hypothetical protein
MSWKGRIRECYRQGLQTTDGLYEEQEAIIEVVEALLEQQNAKNIIEITARCKETTEALIKETEQRIAIEFEECINFKENVFDEPNYKSSRDAILLVKKTCKKYKGVE